MRFISPKVKRRSSWCFEIQSIASLSGSFSAIRSTMSNAKLNFSSSVNSIDLRMPFSSSVVCTNGLETVSRSVRASFALMRPSNLSFSGSSAWPGRMTIA